MFLEYNSRSTWSKLICKLSTTNVQVFPVDLLAGLGWIAMKFLENCLSLQTAVTEVDLGTSLADDEGAI